MLTSPSKASLQTVLRRQTPSSSHHIQRILSHEAVPVLVNLVRRLLLQDLLDDRECEKWLVDEPELHQLHISCAFENQKRGGFKVAYPAYVGAGSLFMKNLPDGIQHEPLYAKQVFYQTERTQSHPLSPSSTIRPYLGPGAICRVEMELKCILWAQALLQLAYDYIDAFDNHHRPPPSHLLDRPHFQFVQAALAIEQGKPSRDAHAFLLEEEIGEMMEGKFRKYFNNTSPVPCQFESNGIENKHRVEFLAFMQHLQYWKTGKLVFVADYQGGNSLLTDPQIITHPSIGDGVFAGGNLSKNWAAFPTHHQCTMWCEYYQLPHDYEEWDKAENAAALQLKLRDLKAEPEAETLENQYPIATSNGALSPYQNQPNAMSIHSIINPF